MASKKQKPETLAIAPVVGRFVNGVPAVPQELPTDEAEELIKTGAFVKVTKKSVQEGTAHEVEAPKSTEPEPAPVSPEASESAASEDASEPASEQSESEGSGEAPASD